MTIHKDKKFHDVNWFKLNLSQDAQGLLEESRSLEKKVHLASEAQKAAKDVEQDYAEVTNPASFKMCFDYSWLEIKHGVWKWLSCFEQ